MNLKRYTQAKKFVKRLSFYAGNFAGYAVPRAFFRWRRQQIIGALTAQELDEARRRAGYYCRLEASEAARQLGSDGDSQGLSAVRQPVSGSSLLGGQPMTVDQLRYPWGEKHKFVTYFFDLYNVLKYFPGHLRFNRIFGDVDFEPQQAAFVKSRPIGSRLGTLLKLNSVRHFRFVRDRAPFAEKSSRLVFRNYISPGQTQRITFMERFFGHPLVDAGIINSEAVEGHAEWNTGFMTVPEMLGYKYIACIEGNDVATNLKWVMSSNSVAVMPRPKFETWFMEGTLRPGYHYIEVSDDYSDLEEKLAYYTAHPDEAEAIIRHAHEHVAQFKNSRLERATALLTAEQYFAKTSQTVG